ncbi:hypothetical protein QUF79_07580 [Fictibacillus enclensis]|uniref:phage tail protein n=1 Tax=Fictibacillus enclensis TaxID=1017270 RepID=UPI0025A0769E|nr:hypothetical protein [Fictibacillus enclensis]MDM5197874.1 hypothetical protein [Fictibacillus enclensis]
MFNLKARLSLQDDFSKKIRQVTRQTQTLSQATKILSTDVRKMTSSSKREYSSLMSSMGVQTDRFANMSAEKMAFYKDKFIANVEAMQKKAGQSSKMLDMLGNHPMYTVSRGLLRITRGLDEIAKKGDPAYVALKQLGKGASLKQIHDRIKLINSGLTRMNQILLFGGMGFIGLNYGLVKASNALDGRLIPALDALKKAWAPVIKPFVQAWTTVVVGIMRGVTAMGKFLGKLSETHQTISKLAGAFIYLTFLFTLLLSPLAICGKLVPGLAIAFRSLWMAVSPFIIGLGTIVGVAALVALAVIGIGAALVIAYKKVDWFRNGVNAAWDWIKQQTAAAYTAIANFIKAKLDQIKQFWASNGAMIKEVMGNVGTVVKGIAMGIFAVMSFVWPAIKSLISSVWSGIKSIISGAVNVILGVVKLFASVLTGNWSAAWSAVKQILKGALQIVIGAVRTTFGSVKDAIASAMASAKDKVAGFFSPLLGFIEKVKSAWSGMVSSIRSFKMPSIGMPKFLGGNGLIQSGKSHAGGLSNVPYNGYQAMLHKGERVLTPEENKAFNNGQTGGNTFKFGDIHINGVGGNLEDAADKLMNIMARKIKAAGAAGA